MHFVKFSFQVSVLIVNSVELCGVLFSSRWKYGSRTSAPNTKKSWNMAADQKSISTAAARSLPAHLGCPNCGRSQWRTKEATCIQIVTWTVLATGIQTTLLTRTPWPGLRWCECFAFDFTQAKWSDPSRDSFSPPTHRIPSTSIKLIFQPLPQVSFCVCQNFDEKTSSVYDVTSTYDRRSLKSGLYVCVLKSAMAFFFLPRFILCMIEFYCKTNYRLNWANILQIKGCPLDFVWIYAYIFGIYPQSWKDLGSRQVPLETEDSAVKVNPSLSLDKLHHRTYIQTRPGSFLSTTGAQVSHMGRVLLYLYYFRI